MTRRSTRLKWTGGNYLGYVRVVGRRQGETKLTDLIGSVPSQYTRKPLLLGEE